MSILKKPVYLSQNGEYNFATDAGAGAIGTRLLGVYIPVKAVTTLFLAIPVTAFAGNAGATISFGTVDEAGVITVNSLMVATPIGAFVPRVPVQGVNLMLNPLSFLNDTVQITMSIAGFVITAGRLAFQVGSTTIDI